MIHVTDLSFAYKQPKNIFSKVEFKIEKGSCVAVLGNNGAGKSTLIKCLNHILSPQEGMVYVNGEQISTLSSQAIAKHFAYVSQQSRAEQFTVFDTVLLGRKPYIKFEPAAEDLEIVTSILTRMGLSDYALRYVDELSGGERQKVMLARAIAQRPKVLLLDEPTSNLDLYNQYDVFETICEIAHSEQMVVLVVIHDLNLALRYCDRFLFIHAGTVHAYGGIEIMTPENIRAVYQLPVAVETVRGVRMVIPLPIA